jgi:hypothetical protein
MHLRHTMLLAALLLALGLPLSASPGSAYAEECTGQNCDPPPAGDECSGEDCDQAPVEKCSGENCTPTDNSDN